MELERWLLLTGWPKYEVSDHGRVRSLYGQQPRFLRPAANRKGYLHVNLYRDKVATTIDVHRLVALAFLGETATDKPDVNHRDGDKANNRLPNLEYCNYAENMRHADEVLGTFPFRGKAHPMARLTDEQVHDIRTLRSEGVRVVLIAERFGISLGHAYDIIKGRYRPSA